MLSALDTSRADELDTQRIAGELGVDSARLRVCTAGEAAEVARDIREGLALDVSATPTYFIDGRRYEGAVPDAVLKLAWQRVANIPPAGEGLQQ